MRFYGSLWRRIAKHDANDSTWFIWDGLQLLQETRNHALVTYVYAPDSDEALARIEDTINDAHWRPEEQRHNQIFYFHPHINGAPEEMTSSGGQVAWQARYKVWGGLLQETDGPYRTPSPEGKDYHPLPQNLRFQGQYFDAETGLHYNTFRYYDPDVGRFTTEDPIGLNGGLNLYQYAPNPFAWIDPWGWKKCGSENGNSRANKKGNHVYEIRNKKTGEIHKYGVSSGRIRKDGKSSRAESQVRALNKPNKKGGDQYESKIITKNVTRDKALRIEKGRVVGYSEAAKKAGKVPTKGGDFINPPGNKLPTGGLR